MIQRFLSCNQLFGPTTIEAAWLDLRRPKVHRSVRSPRPPRFGNSQKVRGTDWGSLFAYGAPDLEIVVRECVRFSESPHCYVLGLAFSNPTNTVHPRNGVFQAL